MLFQRKFLGLQLDFVESTLKPTRSIGYRTPVTVGNILSSIDNNFEGKEVTDEIDASNENSILEETNTISEDEEE